MMMEAMVDFSADQLENISAELMKISQRVFRRSGAPEMHNIKHMTKLLRQMLTQIGYEGEHLSQIRETLLGLQRVITYTMETCAGWRDNNFLGRLETARRDLKSLIEHETHLSDKAQFLLDANLVLCDGKLLAWAKTSVYCAVPKVAMTPKMASAKPKSPMRFVMNALREAFAASCRSK